MKEESKQLCFWSNPIRRLKVLLFVSTIFLVFGGNVKVVYGASRAEIYVEGTSVKAGETIEVPVLIKNNPGIMGLMLKIKYDDRIVAVKRIQSGEILDEGLFQDNLTLYKKGEFDLLWSNTREIKENGVLFYMELTIDEKLKNSTKIEFILSKEDTFNEAFEFVKIKCTDFILRVGEKTDFIQKYEDEKKSEKKSKTEKSEAETNESKDEIEREEKGAVSKDTSESSVGDESVSKKKEEQSKAATNETSKEEAGITEKQKTKEIAENQQSKGKEGIAENQELKEEAGIEENQESKEEEKGVTEVQEEEVGECENEKSERITEKVDSSELTDYVIIFGSVILILTVVICRMVCRRKTK